MKKNVSSILVVVVVIFSMALFIGCDSLKISNLEANSHLKKAHRLYTEEQYKSAVAEYEAALSLNPKLKFTYLYIGTCYSQLYRPAKEDARNKEYGEKAIDNLLKAKDAEPDNDKAIIALGDIYDKVGNFDEAKIYYMKILEKKPNEPNSYYTLANFFTKNGKSEEAEGMYLKRIALDPKNPDGYLYYDSYLTSARRWADAIENMKKHLYALLDPSIVSIMSEISKLSTEAQEVKKVNDFVETVKKNKGVDQAEKDRLINEATQKIQGKLGPVEADKKIVELNAELKTKTTQAEATIPGLDDKKKQSVTECYYRIGNLFWNWSYQTPAEMMVAKERDGIINEGLAALQKATEILPEYPYPYSYMGLLYREKIKVDPAKTEFFKQKNEEWNKKFSEIFSKQKRSEDYKKELDKMGKDELQK